MWSFLVRRMITFAVLALVCLLAAETARNRLALGQRWAGNRAEDGAYEITGSVGAVLPLTEEQRERIYNGVMPYPDTARADARPGLAGELWSSRRLQDLPASVTAEVPLLRAHKFVKLDDRILVINPKARVVVATIPRYRLLP